MEKKGPDDAVIRRREPTRAPRPEHIHHGIRRLPAPVRQGRLRGHRGRRDRHGDDLFDPGRLGDRGSLEEPHSHRSGRGRRRLGRLRPRNPAGDAADGGGEQRPGRQHPRRGRDDRPRQVLDHERSGGHDPGHRHRDGRRHRPQRLARRLLRHDPARPCRRGLRRPHRRRRLPVQHARRRDDSVEEGPGRVRVDGRIGRFGRPSHDRAARPARGGGSRDRPSPTSRSPAAAKPSRPCSQGRRTSRRPASTRSPTRSTPAASKPSGSRHPNASPASRTSRR